MAPSVALEPHLSRPATPVSMHSNARLLCGVCSSNSLARAHNALFGYGINCMPNCGMYSYLYEVLLFVLRTFRQKVPRKNPRYIQSTYDYMKNHLSTPRGRQLRLFAHGTHRHAPRLKARLTIGHMACQRAPAQERC